MLEAQRQHTVLDNGKAPNRHSRNCGSNFFSNGGIYGFHAVSVLSRRILHAGGSGIGFGVLELVDSTDSFRVSTESRTCSMELWTAQEADTSEGCRETPTVVQRMSKSHVEFTWVYCMLLPTLRPRWPSHWSRLYRAIV